MALTQDPSLTKNLLTRIDVRTTFEEDPSLTRSPLTNIQTETTTKMIFEEGAATKRDPSQAAKNELYI